ncbi:MAG: PsbP-related protein [bacterium]
MERQKNTLPVLLVVLFLGTTLMTGPAALQAQSGSYLAPAHVDRSNKFSIKPPAHWWKSTRSRKYAVKLSSRNYKAFIIINVTETEGEVKIDRDFIRFIQEKNKEIAEQVPGFKVRGNRKVEINGQDGYRTHATFRAGENKAVMKIYYVPGKSRLYMITTVCPEFTHQQWLSYFRASVNTFTIIE